jgi:lipooligosaccharide transport system permease protein
MNCNKAYQVPPWWKRVGSVWYRHVRVYNANFFSNTITPFLEPLILLTALGIGLGSYLEDFEGMNYVLFLASGLIVTTAMFTAAYECTFGTFIRLEFDKVYDGILGAPISTDDLIIGEILFAGTKGFFFALAVLIVGWLTGIITYPLSIMAAGAGFLCGVMFAAISMFITSAVNNINHFNFYFTGLLSPMFFFSGVVFPLDNLPAALRYFAEMLPLTHVVRISRAFCVPGGLNVELFLDLLYIVVFILVFGYLAVKKLKRRLIY